MRKINLLYITVAITLAISAVALATNEKQEAEPETTQSLPSWGASKAVAITEINPMFSHDSHVVKHKLSCDKCHPDIFKQEHGAAAKNGDFNMASLEAGKYCGACHNDNNEKNVFGVTKPDTCVKCHGSDMKEPETIVFTKPVKAVIFDHKAHTGEYGLECDACHSEVFKAEIGHAEKEPDKFIMDALYKGEYCGKCHNGSDAFASDKRCTTCHIGVRGWEKINGKTPESNKKH